MHVIVEIGVQHSLDEEDTVKVERSTNSPRLSAEADAVCNAANTALLRAVPDSGFMLAVVKKRRAE